MNEEQADHLHGLIAEALDTASEILDLVADDEDTESSEDELRSLLRVTLGELAADDDTEIEEGDFYAWEFPGGHHWMVRRKRDDEHLTEVYAVRSEAEEKAAEMNDTMAKLGKLDG